MARELGVSKATVQRVWSENEIKPHLTRVFKLWDDEIALAPAGDPAVALLPRNGAYLIYTSGSTGQPKGVLVEHGGFTNMIRDQIERFGVRPEDRGLQFASISYDASMYEIFLALLAGACVAPIPRTASNDAHSFERFLEAQRITMATLSPSFLRTVGHSASHRFVSLLQPEKRPRLKFARK